MGRWSLAKAFWISSRGLRAGLLGRGLENWYVASGHGEVAYMSTKVLESAKGRASSISLRRLPWQ